MKPPASDNEYFWQSPFYRELAQTRMAYFATKKRHVLTSAAVDCPRAQRVWAFLPSIYVSIYLSIPPHCCRPNTPAFRTMICAPRGLVPSLPSTVASTPLATRAHIRARLADDTVTSPLFDHFLKLGNPKVGSTKSSVDNSYKQMMKNFDK